MYSFRVEIVNSILVSGLFLFMTPTETNSPVPRVQQTPLLQDFAVFGGFLKVRFCFHLFVHYQRGIEREPNFKG
jgi:hypothetical protein